MSEIEFLRRQVLIQQRHIIILNTALVIAHGYLGNDLEQAQKDKFDELLKEYRIFENLNKEENNES